MARYDFRTPRLYVAASLLTGATVQLAGTYGLRDEKLDFHGQLRLQAKLSDVTTGFKSLLLKPFDSFFRRNGATVLPIKVTGTRE